MAPSGAADDAAQVEERLKSALFYSVGQTTDHETLALSASTGASHNATPQFIGALTELVWAQIASAGRDLEDFARHAGRATIQTEDVLLLSRRNEGLEALLRGFVDAERAGAAAAAGTGTGTGAGKRKKGGKAKS